jgi:hypothetical protein
MPADVLDYWFREQPPDAEPRGRRSGGGPRADPSFAPAVKGRHTHRHGAQTFKRDDADGV